MGVGAGWATRVVLAADLCGAEVLVVDLGLAETPEDPGPGRCSRFWRNFLWLTLLLFPLLGLSMSPLMVFDAESRKETRELA